VSEHQPQSPGDLRAAELRASVLPYRSVRDDRSSTALIDLIIAVVAAMGGVCWGAFAVAAVVAIFIAKTRLDRLYVAGSCIVLLPLCIVITRALLREARERWERVF